MKSIYLNYIANTTSVGINLLPNITALFDSGCTVPFVARYRKEQTGNCDEVKLAEIKDLLHYFDTLEKRKALVLDTIKKVNKLSAELQATIEKCTNATELEDLYLPYKPGKKTKADLAKEMGLEPLATAMWEQKITHKNILLQRFAPAHIAVDVALGGAQDIVAQWISENASVRGSLRRLFAEQAVLYCKVTRGKKDNEQAQKYRDYFDFEESLKRIPSHRFLAIARGKNEEWLKIKIYPDTERALQIINKQLLRGYSETTQLVKKAATDAYERLLQPSMETESFNTKKEEADEEAIKVFGLNLKQLLLSAPLGEKSIIAIDPGFRTGCKMVALDAQGNLLNHCTIYPHAPQNESTIAAQKVIDWITKYKPQAIAIGDATAGRETYDFLLNVVNSDVKLFLVDESGASIYSASAIGREEFAKHDITVRGAVSIGRRLQDPLSELVKIDAKNLGVGQYQHDVQQMKLRQHLDAVVESCVNYVGVNVNTASKYVLQYVSGLGPLLAQNIVEYRKQNGTFKNREVLKKVARMGGKSFEQCAGFLRIRNGENPLDNSAIHPERYATVKQMAQKLNIQVTKLIANEMAIAQIIKHEYVNENLSMPTISDIITELKKPGLDPRTEANNIEFDQNIRSIDQLESGMELVGKITNITNFGAFVNIGVKENGFLHISAISQKFIKHPSEVLTLNQIVKVRVIDVDLPRKRIGLTMKFDEHS